MNMVQRKTSFLPALSLLVAALLIQLPALPQNALAAQGEQNGEWSNWQAMGEGYTARRRVPAKMDRPVEERRLANVQERLLKVRELRERVAAREVKSDRALARQQRRLEKLDARLARLEKKEQKHLRQRDRKTKPSLWLRTGAAGLYGVSTEELAAQLNSTAKKIRRKARRGRMTLTSGGQPVSWFYDRATDAILFAAEKYETFYTDRNAFHLTMGRSRMAQAMPVINGAPEETPATAAPFIDRLHFEEEPDFLYSTWTVAAEQDADYWFWDYLYGGYKDSIEVTLDVPNPAPTGTARLQVTLRGWTDMIPGDEHQVYAELNGQPVGTMVSWDGFAEAQLVADFDQSLLNEDGNNTLTLHNSYTPGTHPGEWLDEVDLEYMRMPVAVDNTLRLHGVEGGSQVVSGFAGEDIVVIRSPAGDAAMLGDVEVEADDNGGWSVIFNAQEGLDYLVVERSAGMAPVITPAGNQRLAAPDNGADYLIIAPREFSDTAEAMLQYQRDRFANVKIAWLDDIYNQFSYGRVDPAALVRFMEQVRSWTVTPSYVLLVGKGSLDEKNRMGYSDSFLPVLMTSTPWALAASDDRLLGIEDNAAIAVGRIPITEDSEGLAYVDKLIAHSSAPADDSLLRGVLAADNPDDAGDFHLNSDLLADRLLGSLGFNQVDKFYHPRDAVHTALASSATWMAGYVGYDGHGSAAQIGDYRENFLNSATAETLENSIYPLFTALTCAVADDTLPGTRSLSGALVLNPGGGAIASFAPTGLSLDHDAQTLGNAFVDSLYSTGQNTIGQAMIEAKAETRESISDFMPRVYEVVGDPSVYVR